MAAATQNQALAALLFLYKQALEIELPWLDQIVRSKRPKRLPVVLTRIEVRAVLGNLSGRHWLVASLLYGSGLRLLEALHLRIKDVDPGQRKLIVRDAKGMKDRVTVLPDSLVEPLRRHIAGLRASHQNAVAGGFGGVELPLRSRGSIRMRTLTSVAVPVSRRSSVARSKERRVAARSQRTCSRQGTTYGPCRSCSGTATSRTTQIYTHVLNRGGFGVRSPMDLG